MKPNWSPIERGNGILMKKGSVTFALSLALVLAVCSTNHVPPTRAIHRLVLGDETARERELTETSEHLYFLENSRSRQDWIGAVQRK